MRPYPVIAKVASAISILLSCVVLLGWQFNIAQFKSMLPGFATMKANTALCFLLSGVSLWLFTALIGRSPGLARKMSIAARACAAVVLLAGLITCAEDWFDVDGGIDELIFAAGPADTQSMYPARMSAATAVNFVLLGATLLLLGDERRRCQEISQHCALAVVWIAFVAFVGYAYGKPLPFGGARLPVASLAFSSMAVHTSLSFVLLGLGAFVVRPDTGLMATISSPFVGGSMARRVLPITVLIASFLFWLGIAGRQSASYDTGFLVSILAVAIISMLALVIWTNARTLNELDEKRIEAEKKILESLREKEVLLKEIHHRVKNNLQIVSSLLNLQSRDVQTDDTRRIFAESRLRIHTMALIHEQLYKSADLAQVRFADYLQELVGHVLRSHGGSASKIHSKISVEDIGLPVDVAIPCALIVNELVSNSLKYAFPGGRPGEIRITLQNTPDQQATLSVTDTGIGFPHGMDLQNSPTLGLRLVRTLARQLGSSAKFNNHGGAGVEVTFRPGATS